MSRTDESKRRKDNCVECKNFKPIKAKKMCQNCWHKFKRKWNPDFYLSTRYTEIKQRCTNPNNTTSKYYNGLSICSREEFINKFRHDIEFLTLYKKWQASNFDYRLTPSIDRRNPNIGYTIDNIQVITHSDNCTKDQLMQEVLCYDKEGRLTVYESQSEAARQLNIPQANIWKVIKGERKTAGGYIFIGGDFKNVKS